MEQKQYDMRYGKNDKSFRKAHAPFEWNSQHPIDTLTCNIEEFNKIVRRECEIKPRCVRDNGSLTCVLIKT
jgi:hypothetical protein